MEDETGKQSTDDGADGLRTDDDGTDGQMTENDVATDDRTDRRRTEDDEDGTDDGTDGRTDRGRRRRRDGQDGTDNIYIYMTTKFQNECGANIVMSQCDDHGTTSLDIHNEIPLDSRIYGSKAIT